MKTRLTVSKISPRSAAGAYSSNRLERGLDCWKLQFEGRSAVVRDSRGLLLIAQLLARPNADPIHALQLVAWTEHGPIAGAALELPAPDGVRPALVTATAQVSQRSLQRDDWEALRQLRQKVREIESVLDDPGESEVVKAEAEEELTALRQAQRQLLRTNQDAPRLSVRAVRRAMIRSIKRMAAAVDHRGEPLPVLRDFARHLHLYLVVPSSRYCGPRAPMSRAELEGCYQYTPPKGVRWTIH